MESKQPRATDDELTHNVLEGLDAASRFDLASHGLASVCGREQGLQGGSRREVDGAAVQSWKACRTQEAAAGQFFQNTDTTQI